MTEQERRSDDRLPVLWKGTLEAANGETFPCELRDVSLAGALISCAKEFDDSEQLVLTIDGIGDFAGTVRWRGSDTLGLLLLAGPDLMLKKFAEKAGAEVSTEPQPADAG